MAAASAPGNEGFTIDLFDNSLHDPAAIVRPSSLSTIRVDHDAAGMLAINLPSNLCHSLQFGFIGSQSGDDSRESSKKFYSSGEHHLRESEKESLSDEECVKKTHSLLREVHQAIFDEQVFDLVNREAFNTSLGFSVTGIRQNYLQLSLGQGTSVFLSLVSSGQDDQTVDGEGAQNVDDAILPLDSLDGVMLPDEKQDTLKKWGFPNHLSCEIYLQQIFHEHVLGRGNEKPISTGGRLSGHPVKDGSGLLGHFCMSLAHRIFSNKVLMVVENVVSKVPYLQLISHPTWHSRRSSWTLVVKVPQSILHARCESHISAIHNEKNSIKSHFRTKVVVNDDCINVEGEGVSNVIGLLKAKSEESHSMHSCNCDLADLSMIILQQVASQVIGWLFEEALMVGIKANRDFLRLSVELEQRETLSLVAHVDPEDSQGCISWWLVMEDSFAEERKLMDVTDAASDYRKFLGHLSLDVLYSTLMDLVSLCGGGGQ